MGDYQDNPTWADVVPIPQDDGGPNPLAAISYTEGYAEAMSYLRAVMAANEMSERALELTEDIISMNPAHYTVWLYRAKILTALSSSLADEVEWLNVVALTHQKNYQIWHHRQFLLDRINDPDGEIAFINRMLAGDAKNYHVWSYRQWLVRRFGLWTTKQENGRADLALSREDGDEADGDDDDNDDDDDEEAPDLAPAAVAVEDPADQPLETTELEETEWYIARDVRNNSAWNHRFFVVHGSNSPSSTSSATPDSESVQREIKFAQAAIRLAPQNQSPWNYLRGIVERSSKGKEGVVELEGFCREFVEVDGQGEVGRVSSSHALDLLAEIWGRDRARKERVELAGRAYTALGEKYDPIRVGYWEWLRGRLGEGGNVGAAVKA